MPDNPSIQLPPQPQLVAETKLPFTFITDLVLKTLYFASELTGAEIASRTCLAWAIVEDAIKFLADEGYAKSLGMESGRAPDTSFAERLRYGITQAGRERSRELLQVSQYAGPAPVALDVYVTVVGFQARHNPPVPRGALQNTLNDLVLPTGLLDSLGPGLNARQPIFLYGPPGNGKSSIAMACGKLLGGPVFIPHAIYIHGEVVRLLDPTHHRPIAFETSKLYDRRWVLCERPRIGVGGELTVSSLELSFDQHLGFYEAPLQLKANGGMLLIDDFGRQQIKPAELLNRLIVPLESGFDFLNVARAGTTVKVPFSEILMLSTNLDPKDLMDDAFLRRVHYKVPVPNASPDAYKMIFERVCSSLQIPYAPAAVDYLIKNHYEPSGRQLHGCDPRDLLMHLKSVAAYMGMPARLTPDLIDQAARTYFANLGASAGVA